MLQLGSASADPFCGKSVNRDKGKGIIMSDTRKTLSARIAEDGITSTTRYGSETRPDWAVDSDAWTVTLQHGDRTMVVPFFMGAAFNSGEPSAAQVLQCLLSDASGVENARGFEDWALEYGFDPDSRKAEKIYRDAYGQTAELHEFLGEKFDAYVWETDED